MPHGELVNESKEHRALNVARVLTEIMESEAGRKGGKTTLKKYGTEFYQKIGQKGGRKGGQTTKQRYGTEFYQEIGRKGGLK